MGVLSQPLSTVSSGTEAQEMLPFAAPTGVAMPTNKWSSHLNTKAPEPPPFLSRCGQEMDAMAGYLLRSIRDLRTDG